MQISEREHLTVKNNVIKNFTKIIIFLFGIITIGVLFFIFAFIFYKGIGVISFKFLTETLKGLPLGTDGGIYPVIIGSIFLGILSVLIAAFIGIPAGVYLAFYRKDIFYKPLNAVIMILSGIPSIIYGLVGYTFLIYFLNIKKSILTAAITVGIMIVPFVVIRVKKTLIEKGQKMLVVAKTLGISKEYSLIKLIIPHCKKEILQALGIGGAYGMGAVAPIMYTGVVMNAKIPGGPLDPFMSLPYHLYMLVVNEIGTDYAYGTALVLLVIVFLIQVICRVEFGGNGK